MDIGSEVAWGQADNDRFGGQVRKGKVYGTSGGNALEDLVLADPAHAAGPIALPASTLSLRDADRPQMGLLRIRLLGQPENPSSILHVPPQLVRHALYHN